MDKRHQVFVSSTYRDLQAERREVIQALLEMSCIPAGMELFPAADDDAWTLIQGVIRESDYYVLVIGGRYGSTDEAGVSYTEKEYDYAVEVGVPIAPFLHGDPGKIPAECSEMDHAAQEKLADFRAKVEGAHTCKYWTTPEDLGGKVSRAMNLLMKNKPRRGWVQADQAVTAEMLSELNALRSKVDTLQKELENARVAPPPGAAELAQGGDLAPISVKCQGGRIGVDAKGTWVIGSEVVSSPCTWDDLFRVVGPLLLDAQRDWEWRSYLEKNIAEVIRRRGGAGLVAQLRRAIQLSDDDFQMIKVQFMALGLIEREGGGKGESNVTVWRLTRYGEEYLTRVRAVRRTDEESQS